MGVLGPTLGFWSLVGFWVAKVVLFTLVCFFLGWLGLRVLDALTPAIHQRKEIGEDPISIGLFIAGFLFYVGLVIHGAVSMPTAVGASLLGSLIDLRRLGLIAIAFVVSLLLGVAIFNLLDRLTPYIPFRRLRGSSIGTGLYVFGYFVFLGLITNAAFATVL